MSLTIPLPPDLAARLAAVAAQVGVAPAALAVEMLARSLPPADRRAAAIALLDSWLDEPSPTEQRESGDILVRGLDANRRPERPHFPPALEGVTW